MSCYTIVTSHLSFLSLFSAVVVAVYEEPVQPQQAASVVEKLGDYLITCGY